tara:strand:+ start:6098 stop:10387 length:4290 start_codon:yes stop_codon:yes gene_type:complete
MAITTEIIKKVTFDFLTDDDVRKLSNVTIATHHLYSNNLPNPDGLYDLHLGSINNSMTCATCGNKGKRCLGHGGDYELKYPVIKPLFYDDLKKILKIFCPHCSSVQIDKNVMLDLKKKKISKTIMINKIIEIKKNSTTCIECKKKLYNYVKGEKDLFIYYSDDYGNKKIYYTHLIYDMLNKIPDEVIHNLDISHPKHYIQNVLFIPPNQLRPVLKITTADKTVNDQITTHLQNIIKQSDNITPIPNDILEIDDENISKIRNMNMELKSLVVGVGASNYNKNIISSFKSITDRLKSKTGLIRSNILGRRAHGMTRAVIICDVDMPLDYIRIPIHFAKNVTIKEVVTDFNRHSLEQYVENGIDKYPGAQKIFKIKTGFEHSLLYKPKKGIILENGDIIYRDLIDHDVVYFNRQPTLTYSCISAIKVIVDKNPNFYSIGMNVIICRLFGADFDGDQMACLILNNLPCRVEAFNLAGVHKHVMSKQFSTMHLGQTYDSVIGCFLTTRDDVLVDKKMTLNILSNLKYLNSCIIDKFNKYFKNSKTGYINGRQLMSIVLLPHITIKCKTEWYNPSYENFYKYNENEKYVNIQNGEIISGVLDKATIGENGQKNSIYNIIYNEYSDKRTIIVMANMQAIALSYLVNYKGFSLSIKDVMVGNANIKEIRDTVLYSKLKKLEDVRGKIINNKFIYPIGQNALNYFEEQYLELGKMEYINIGKYIDFNDNNVLKLAMSGSKGKLSQALEMIAVIGFKLINGADLISNNKFSYFRTSPYFQRYDISPEAKGYVVNSYFSGTVISEYLTMSIAGRHDIVVKALLTANAGDQNRKSIKSLESLTTNNIRSIENNINIVQLMYGYDNIDVINVFQVNLENDLIIPMKEFKNKYYNNDTEYDKLVKFKKEISEISINYTKYNYLTNIFTDVFKFKVSFNPKIILNKFKGETVESDKKLNEMYNKIDTFCNELHYVYFNNNIKQKKNFYIPQIYKMGMYITEFVIRLFFCINNLKEYKISSSSITYILYELEYKILRSFIQPGNPIGVLTAQCISEPLTQSTLDTHRGSAMENKRKTGMKRLKEVLSVKATEKLPDLMMTFQLNDKYKNDKKYNEDICNKIVMVKLKSIVNYRCIFHEDIPSVSNPNTVIHDDYLDDNDLIAKFLEYNVGTSIPKNLSSFNVRLEIDKYKLYDKKLNFNNVIDKIKKEIKGSFIVYSNENDKKYKEQIIMKIYVNENYILKKNKLSVALIENQLDELLNVNISGIDNITNAYISEIKSYNYLNNEFIKTSLYVITTIGLNYYTICRLKDIDKKTIQVDDILTYNKIFGIIAAKLKIAYELKDLIDDKLNFKHYMLIADLMCRNGNITSIEKNGIDKREKNNILLRLGTSHTRQILNEAVTNNITCDVKGLTPSLMVGAVHNDSGTYMNDISVDINQLKDVLKIKK